MLTLNRKVGEQIVIGDGEDAIVVTLVAITERRTAKGLGRKCRIGITAKPEIPIVRSELLKPKEDEE